MSGRRTLAVARKEILHIARDPRSLAMALAMPLGLLLLFGYAVSLDVDRIPTLVYDADRTPQSRELIEAFHGSRYFEFHGYADGYRPIEERIDSAEILMGLVIPPDYTRKLLAGQAADVQVLLDGSDSNTAGIALGYVNAVLAAHSLNVRAEAQRRKLGREIKPPAEAQLRVWYNSELKSRNYIVPGLIAVILMIIASLLTSLTIAREWEMGTMEQVLSTPLRPAEMALGKMAAYFLIGAADTVTAIVAGVWFFDVPLRGSVLLLAASCGVFLVGALFWGIFISAAARSQLLAYQAGVISSFLPAFLLSGFIYAIENMPRPIQAVTHLVPARYFIEIGRGIFLKGVGLETFGLELALLCVFAVVVFFAATRKLKRKVA
ncbi:MAG: ABC transporter permease [Bryobacteraceae bacterium]|nr:ABC transporter permease [Bryobacteraceae bacterium]